MKKMMSGIAGILLCAAAVWAQSSVDLPVAIDRASAGIVSVLPESGTTGVLFDSGSKNLSRYLSQEVEKKLKQKNVSLVVRDEKTLDSVERELSRQYSGYVSDDKMVELGNQLGASHLVFGTFEQIGGMMQLSVQAINVETCEILYTDSFIITKTQQVVELLGDDMKLVTAEDYLHAIASCNEKMNSIEREKNSRIGQQASRVRGIYNAQISEIRLQEKEPWENKAEYAARIDSAVAEVEKKQSSEIDSIEKENAIMYGNKMNQVKIQKEKLEKDLLNTTFVLQNDEVSVYLGAFNAEENPKNWPVTISANTKQISFSLKDKYVVNDSDVKTEYKAVEAARKEGLAGEIQYKLIKGNIKDTFDVYIVSARIYIKSSGKSILTKNINENAGRFDASKTVISSSKSSRSTRQNALAKETNTQKKNSIAAESGKESLSYSGAGERSGAESSAGSRKRPEWVSNMFSLGYFFIRNQDYSMKKGFSAGLLGSCWGAFYIDWLNFDMALGDDDDSAYWDLFANIGVNLRISKVFFPYIEAGAGYYNVKYSLHEYGDLVTAESSGLLASVAAGLDLKLSSHVKLMCEYNLKFLTDAPSVAADSMKVGLTFGNPCK
ncbi:MAG: hypothetical protein J6K96_01480 [Treponema sp.]|nr:hypothetical protein [Treponema sp.]